MHTKLNDQIQKILFRFMLGVGLFISFVVIGSPVALAETIERGEHYTINTGILSNGTLVDQVIINGPPVPPPGFDVERQAASLPRANIVAGTKTLTVPAFNWVMGCSAVSGAMIAGYYDRLGWSNIYTGPTNGGVMPLDNSSWPTWSDGYTTYPSCPLIVSKNGVDGRATRGSIDDYWVQYNSTASDPYITHGWTQHTWGDAIGDYMWTSQFAYGNTDGSTMFWNYSISPNKLTCATMASGGYKDGTLGRKLFYEARGYTVTDCYNQKTDNTIPGGFSFAQFKAEIDAGRPVMLNLAGHTVVGVGYDDSSNLVYIHDTWDYNNHTMTWGTSYSGMALLSVSIVNIQVPAFEETDSAISYTGAWSNYTCSGCSAGGLKYSSQTGATATFSFNGTGIKWIVAKAKNLGKAKVTLDGNYLGLVDLYKSTSQFKVPLQKTGLASGAHTVILEVSGQKNTNSTGYIVDIDAFEVIP